MTARPLYARLGLEVRPTGSSGTLATSIGGMALDASNRIGFYADTTGAAEYLGFVAGGTEVGRFHNDLVDNALELLGPATFANQIRVGNAAGGHVPANGDFWYNTGTNMFQFRQNGTKPLRQQSLASAG